MKNKTKPFEDTFTPLTMNDTVGDLYKTPVGHDTLLKVLLQIGIPESAVTNPAVSSMKLSTVAKLAEKTAHIDPHFFETLLFLINMEHDTPTTEHGPIKPAWWKEAVFYQIYPRSFCDKNGDGMGDLEGIISKLDYLKDLGVDALWLSPIYDSPNDDNGYDIRDYRKIQEQFGTMEDFDHLLEGVHARGMKLIMDLVVNHTSDEHEWFQKALSDPTSPCRDYYFLVPEGQRTDGTPCDPELPPNNWTSFFSGSAWNHYKEQGLWGLHLFSKKQMDLNWDNPALRKEVIDMIRWWLEKGVDGFRMDVINYISKTPGLPNGDESVGSLMNFTGVEHYYYGPHLHEYLHQIYTEAFEPYGAFSVGETPGAGMEMSKLLTSEKRGEMNMVFSFDQLETPGHVRYHDYKYDLNYYRDYITDWMMNYGSDCWMSLFYNNHDNPRMVSKVSTNPAHRQAIEKLLAMMQFTLRGTPFIFQGDEMGLTNYDFTSIDQVQDVEAVNYYDELLFSHTEAEALGIIRAGTRDHARVMLPWDDQPQAVAGSTSAKPLTHQEIDPEITAFYRRLIRFRKRHHALIYGDFQPLCLKKDHFTYRRTLGDETYIIECNLSDHPVKSYLDKQALRLIICTHRGRHSGKTLLPYEARLFRLQ
ncbi:MAG: alpha-glucosidase [Firmicutes bacterium]|nr:alpha-glucosidase [Bacillota bacterium]